MTRRYFKLAFASLLVFILLILGLLGTEPGSRWLMAGLAKTLPGELRVEQIAGDFLSHIAFNGLDYSSQTDQITISRLDLRWQPWQLLSGTLKINNFSADGIVVTLKPDDKPKESPTNFADGVKLPVKPNIDHLAITNLKINSGQTSQFIRSLQLSLKSEGERIHLQALKLDAGFAQVNAQGAISTAKGFPLDLTVDWQSDMEENGNWQGTTKLSGNMAKLNITNKLSSPFTFNLQGDIQDVMTLPRLNLQGEWEKLAWPPAPQRPQIQSPHGTFQLTGLLSAYQLKIAGNLTQQFLPGADLTFDGTGGMTALIIKKLDITSATGLFHLAGNVDWQAAPLFDLALSGVDFNPAIIAPDLPGSLNFSTRIKGKIDPKAIQVRAELNKIAGRLRQQPFEAIGTLNLNGEQLKIGGLQVESGVNKIAVNGHIDKHQGDLSLDIDMPKLSGLWPGLSGKLDGGGQIKGGWNKPSVNFKLAGKSIGFAGNSLEQLDLAVDYLPDDNKTSTVSLSTSRIKLGNNPIDKITLNGKGSLKQHDFQVELISPKGNLATAIAGHWQAPVWQGELTRLAVSEQNAMIWTLAKTVPLRLEQKPKRIDFVMDEACLVRQASALCAEFARYASSDLLMKMTATALPGSLLQPWLGPENKLETTLDGKVDLKQSNNVLAGSYHFSTSPTLISINNKELSLQPSSLAGNINGDTVMADLDLHLAGDDFLRGKLQLDIGPRQTINGKINADIADFSPVKAFAPQIEAIKGRFSADLKLNGPLKKPQLLGRFDLANADIDMARFALRKINLAGRIDSSQGNRLTLQGSAEPLIINDPEAEQNINVKSVINLSADIRQSPTMKGEFLLDLPSTQLSVQRGGFDHAFQLSRSTVKGQILNKTLLADINLALPQQDYVRGKLSLVNDDSQALSAQFKAAIHDFKLVEAFVPDLSKMQGVLTADLDATGNLQRPKINATLDFNNGAVAVERIGLAIKDIDLHAYTPLLTDELIQLRGGAQSGNGKISLDGTINLDPALQRPIKLLLQGKDFEVAKLPEAEVAVSPDLTLTATDAGSKITGTLDIPKALLKMQEIPENAVKVSPDEIILGEEPPEETEVSAPGIFADVLVKLGKRVNFTGQGLTTDLNGQLHVIKERDKLTMQGSVNMANGKYKSYGQDLTVRKGQFVFNGPVDNPWLNVEAIRLSKDKKVTALLNLSGSVEHPQTRISSEPSLPESEALAYLITGGPLNQVSKSEGNVLASAAISYGADQAGWLADKLGFSDFSVQQGSTLKDTLLVMGKYLTPDFYMGAKVGMFNKQAVMVLKHKLINNLNVETQAGTSQRVKLNYEFDGN